jgi:hypothetical protein
MERLPGGAGEGPRARPLGKYFVARQYFNPTSEQGSQDQVDAIYQIDAQGNARPVQARNNHSDSTWTAGRDLAIAATLGIGGAYLGAGALAGGLGGAESGAVAAGNGAFLGEGAASGIGAWDAAAGGLGGQRAACPLPTPRRCMAPRVTARAWTSASAGQAAMSPA